MTSLNFLLERQTPIPILLAHKRHNSLALSSLGLKFKERPIHVLVQKSGMRSLLGINICQRNPSKTKKKELSS